MKRGRTLYAAMLLSALALVVCSGSAWAQYPRIVLLEEFTSNTCKPCTLATPILNKILAEKGGRVVTVRYHMNMPLEGDPWYAANPTENDARGSYYSVISLPNGRLDGATSVSVTSENDVFDKVEDRMEIQSPIKLEVTQTRGEGNSVNVQVKATAGAQGLTGNGFTLHVAALEAHIHDESYQSDKYNKEKDFEDVMRKLVAGAEGEEITLSENEVKTFNFSYTIGANWQPEQMYSVAFVQNDFSKEVVQAGFSVKLAAGVHEQTAIAGYALAQSFPNPARSEARIDYTLGRAGEVVVELYNAAGAMVSRHVEGVREEGAHQFRLDLTGLPAGAYTYTLQSGAYRASGQMTVVK